MNEAPESFATTDGKNEPANLQGSHGSSHSKSSAEIHDRTGLYIAIIALLVAGMGLGFEISRAMSTSELRELQSQSIDARIQAGVARAEAEANEAKVTARVAMKEVGTLCASLKASRVANADCH